MQTDEWSYSVFYIAEGFGENRWDLAPPAGRKSFFESSVKSRVAKLERSCWGFLFSKRMFEFEVVVYRRTGEKMPLSPTQDPDSLKVVRRPRPSSSWVEPCNMQCSRVCHGEGGQQFIPEDKRGAWIKRFNQKHWGHSLTVVTAEITATASGWRTRLL